MFAESVTAVLKCLPYFLFTCTFTNSAQILEVKGSEFLKFSVEKKDNKKLIWKIHLFRNTFPVTQHLLGILNRIYWQNFIFLNLAAWGLSAACGIFTAAWRIQLSGIEPKPSTLGTQSLNHWTTTTAYNRYNLKTLGYKN